MANLHLRDVDEVLVRKLHQRAKANGHSAAEEHRQILREALTGGVREDIHELAAQIRESVRRSGIPQTPAEDLIREDRDDPDR